MKCNKAGLILIKAFEGCKLEAYQDQRGIWTIGYGHTGNVGMGEVITEERAEALLVADLGLVEDALNSLQLLGIGSNSFSALCSLGFNIGVTALTNSTLIRYLEEGQFNAAANQFLAWDHCNGQVNEGLMRRRQAERSLFLTPDTPATPHTYDIA